MIGQRVEVLTAFGEWIPATIVEGPGDAVWVEPDSHGGRVPWPAEYVRDPEVER